MGITVTHEHSHTLYNLEKWEKWPAEYQNSYLRAHYYLNCRIIEMNAGKPPLTYKQFQRIIEGMEPPAKPVPTLTLQVTNWSYCTNSSITAPSWSIKFWFALPWSFLNVTWCCPFQMLGSSTTPLQDDHDEKFGVPSLEELGFDCESLKPPVWHGGEMEALSRLERHLERKAWVASFGLPKMTPQVTR